MLRPLAPADRRAYAGILAAPEVRRHLGRALLPRAAPGWAAARDIRLFRRRWVWAVEERGRLVGRVGFSRRPGWSPLTDVEIGWLLAPDVWGRGYATEAASAALGSRSTPESVTSSP